MTRPVQFMRVWISLPCPVPVLPGTPDTMDEQGEPIPMEKRTERCHVDAFWWIGSQPTCDIHARVACDLLSIDFDGLVEEAGGLAPSEEKPWHERHRYPQEMRRDD